MRNLLLCCIFLAASTAYGQLFPALGGQRAGISALTFLKLELSPRAAGLGGAAITLPGDGYAAAVNPALMAENESFHVASGYTRWAADINYGYLGLVQPTRAGHFGLSITGLSSGAMPVRTEFQPGGTGEYFYANTFTAGLSYAKQLTEMFRYGLTLRYIREDLAQFSAQTATLDLGFLYRTDVNDLSFSVLVQNFGLNSAIRGIFNKDSLLNSGSPDLSSFPAPTVFKLGLSMTVWRDAEGQQSLTAAAQLDHPNDNAESLRFGMEYQWRQLLYLRAGYKINVDEQNLPTAGIGLRMRMGRHPMRLDYAYDPVRNLGAMHRIGLDFALNKS